MKVIVTIMLGLAFCAPSSSQTPEQQRLAKAKTYCYGVDGSGVTWNKEDKKPTEAEISQYLHHIQTIVDLISGLSPYKKAASCLYADLVVSMTVDLFYAADHKVSIKVTDADSGENVFSETQDVTSEYVDLRRLVLHFGQAANAAKAAQEDSQKRQQEQELFASLPTHWYYERVCPATTSPVAPQPCLQHTTDIKIVGDTLSEEEHHYEHKFTSGTVQFYRDANCTLSRAPLSETPPWSGTCTYKFFWNTTMAAGVGAETFGAVPTCTVTTVETITSVSRTEIQGTSQQIDYTPLHQPKKSCPVLGNTTSTFTMYSGDEHAVQGQPR